MQKFAEVLADVFIFLVNWGVPLLFLTLLGVAFGVFGDPANLSYQSLIFIGVLVLLLGGVTLDLTGSRFVGKGLGK